MNLKTLTAPPIRTAEEAAKKGRAGGKKSGEVRRAKKLLSQMWAAYLTEKRNIVFKDGKKAQDVKDAADVIISRGDSASVAMLREIREATEGSKIALDEKINVKIEIVHEKE
jgi:hypothetical protein